MRTDPPPASPNRAPSSAIAELVGAMSRPRAPGVLLGRLVASGSPGLLMARVIRSPMRVRTLTVLVTRLHAWLLGHTGGRLRRSWLFAAGQPVIALTTTGRRSGLERTTAVAVLTHEGRLATVGMNLGLDRNPSWSYNLQANPEAWIEINATTIPVTARQAAGEERDQLWRCWLALQPSARTFAELADRQVPIFVLEPGREPAPDWRT